jgi:hypothetical protein
MAAPRKERCDQMAALVGAGNSLSAVALQFKVSNAAVWSACKLRNVEATRNTRTQRCDDMAARVAAGESLGQVGKAFGVTPVAVHKACTRRGVFPVLIRAAKKAKAQILEAAE